MKDEKLPIITKRTWSIHQRKKSGTLIRIGKASISCELDHEMIFFVQILSHGEKKKVGDSRDGLNERQCDVENYPMRSAYEDSVERKHHRRKTRHVLDSGSR